MCSGVQTLPMSEAFDVLWRTDSAIVCTRAMAIMTVCAMNACRGKDLFFAAKILPQMMWVSEWLVY